MYTDKFDADLQISLEERISSIVHEYTAGLVEEEDCSELGRRILLRIVQTLRSDLCAK